MTTSILCYGRGLSQLNRKEKEIKRKEAKEESKNCFSGNVIVYMENP